MSKMDEVRRTLAGNMDASMGVGRPADTLPPGMTPGAARRAPDSRDGVARTRNALDIPTDKIQPDPDQPREDFDAASLDRLAESLKTKGQLQPIRVRWDEGGRTYVIIAGERRWRAAVRAGLSTLTAIVHEGAPDAAERLAIQLVENALREDLKPVEAAKAYRRLMAANGWTGLQLARELHVAQSIVSQTLALLDLPSDVQAQVDAGEVAARTGYELSKLHDAEEMRELADQAAAGNLPLAQAAGREVRLQVRRWRQGRRDAAAGHGGRCGCTGDAPAGRAAGSGCAQGGRGDGGDGGGGVAVIIPAASRRGRFLVPGNKVGQGPGSAGRDWRE
jgi:ParB family chromosome partitioning protein